VFGLFHQKSLFLKISLEVKQSVLDIFELGVFEIFQKRFADKLISRDLLI
jgi:hypothetical protein